MQTGRLTHADSVALQAALLELPGPVARAATDRLIADALSGPTPYGIPFIEGAGILDGGIDRIPQAALARCSPANAHALARLLDVYITGSGRDAHFVDLWNWQRHHPGLARALRLLGLQAAEHGRMKRAPRAPLARLRAGHILRRSLKGA